MARFPTRENDVAALAIQVIEGLTKNGEVFPAPPVPPEELTAALQASGRFARLRQRRLPLQRTPTTYRFHTIRPASYPDSDNPAHVHMHVLEVGCCTYYIDSIHFEDDPLLSREERDSFVTGRGGSGLVRPDRDESGVWVVTRDIMLGEGVPGYP